MSSYQTIADLENEQFRKHTQQRKNNAVTCPTCDSQWFTEQKVGMFEENHQVITGQSVPKMNTIDYIFLKCVRCEELIEPRILHNVRDAGGGDYNYLVDTLEGIGDKRTQPESGTNDKVQADRL